MGMKDASRASTEVFLRRWTATAYSATGTPATGVYHVMIGHPATLRIHSMAKTATGALSRQARGTSINTANSQMKINHGAAARWINLNQEAKKKRFSRKSAGMRKPFCFADDERWMLLGGQPGIFIVAKVID